MPQLVPCWLRINAPLVLTACALISVATSAFNTVFAAFSLIYLGFCTVAHVIRVIKTRQNRPSLIPSPMHAAMLGLLLMGALSLLITAIPELTNVQVTRLFVGMGAGWGMRNWLKHGLSVANISVAPVLLVISGLGAGFSLLAPVGVDWPSGKLPIPLGVYAFFPRWLGDGIHPNVMAGLLVLLLPISITAAFAQMPMFPVAHRIAVLLMALMLVLTQSRGGLLAFAASLIVLVGLLRPRTHPFIAAFVATCLALASVSMLAPAALPAPLQAFIQNMLLVSSSSTAELRYEAWQRAWYMIQDFPITGIGMGSYKLVADIMYPTFVSAEALPHAHNLFLQVAVDLGLPGLLAWLTIVATAISATAHVIQHSRTPTNQYNLQSAQRTLAIGLLASQAALLIHGLVDAVVWGQVRLAPLVWLLFGLALGLQSARYTQQPDAQPHHSI